MNTNVYVLAVLDAYVEFWSKELVRTRRDFDLHDSARSKLAVVRNARDAVAELIEAATEGRNETSGRIIFYEAQANRLRTALARVKGA